MICIRKFFLSVFLCFPIISSAENLTVEKFVGNWGLAIREDGVSLVGIRYYDKKGGCRFKGSLALELDKKYEFFVVVYCKYELIGNKLKTDVTHVYIKGFTNKPTPIDSEIGIIKESMRETEILKIIKFTGNKIAIEETDGSTTILTRVN